MDAYNKAQNRVNSLAVENNVVRDLFDLVLFTIQAHRHRWPARNDVVAYMVKDALGLASTADFLMAVTAEELSEHAHTRRGGKLFRDLDHAVTYLSFYAGEVKVGGTEVLRENRGQYLWTVGNFWKDKTNPDGLHPGFAGTATMAAQQQSDAVATGNAVADQATADKRERIENGTYDPNNGPMMSQGEIDGEAKALEEWAQKNKLDIDCDTGDNIVQSFVGVAVEISPATAVEHVVALGEELNTDAMFIESHDIKALEVHEMRHAHLAAHWGKIEKLMAESDMSREKLIEMHVALKQDLLIVKTEQDRVVTERIVLKEAWDQLYKDRAQLQSTVISSDIDRRKSTLAQSSARTQSTSGILPRAPSESPVRDSNGQADSNGHPNGAPDLSKVNPPDQPASLFPCGNSGARKD